MSGFVRLCRLSDWSRFSGFGLPYVGTVAVSFGEDANEAGFSVEDTADVVGCHLSVTPSGRNCLGHDVFWRVAHFLVNAHDVSDGAAWE